MSSRFNTLYLGSAADAADALEDRAEEDSVRLALINALRRIEQLEKRLAEHKHKVRDDSFDRRWYTTTEPVHRA